MKFKPSILIPALATLAAAPAFATDYQWNGNAVGNDGNWNTDAWWTGTAPADSGGTGANRVNVNGAATLIYSAAQGTTVYANTAGRGLVVGSGALGVGSMTITGGTFSTLGSLTSDFVGNASGTSTLTLSGGTYIGNSAGLTIGAAGTGILQLNSGTASLFTLVPGGPAAKLNFNGGTLQARVASTAFVPSGMISTVQLNGAKIDTNGFDVTVASALTHDSALGATADGGLTKSGTGILTVSGTNTFTGATAVNAGALLITNASALGTTAAGTSVALNAALALSGGINYSSAESVTLTGPGLTAASGVFASVQRGALQSVSGNNTFAGNITFTDSGNTRIGVQNGASLILSGNITESVANSSLIFRHSTTGVGNITLSGTGNSWTGNTDIYGGAGAVILGVDNAIPTTSHLRVGTTGVGTASTLDMNGKVQTVKGLSQVSAGSNGVITNNGNTNSTLTLANLSANQNYNGAIKDGTTNTVALTLDSAGKTQTLSGTNTYTGATTVSAGTLLVTGALGNSPVSVGANGSIGGSGTIDGTLTLDSGADLNLTGATLGLTSTGILTVAATKTITLSNFNFTDIIGWDYANAAEGTYTLINGGSSVTFGGSTPIDVGTAYDFGNGRKGYFQQGSLQAVIIPEPASALLGGIGLLALLRRRRG